ncbi:MAG: phosphate ABC transporter ATP-binding protein PstB [Phycisphaerales bacterium]
MTMMSAQHPTTSSGAATPAPAARGPNPLGALAERAALQRGEQADAGIAIRIEGFNCWYGDFQALRDIALEIPVRRVMALIGPSGCGKSTLLRWINRMNDLVRGARCDGTMSLHGIDLLERRLDVVDLRRRIGMVFQKPNPFPKSIYDNVAFGPRLHFKIARRDLDQVVEQSLKGAALWDEVKDRLHKSALGLSGGQQQRLCIARAIAVGPEVLLMDEPASALDPKSTLRIEELIRELRKNYTIVIVTHNMQQAARVSDNTAFFYEGRLIETGATAGMFMNPTNKQTEDYVLGRFG